MANYSPSPAVNYGHSYTVTWALTTADATGNSFEAPSAADKTVQAFGTFGSGSLAFQGSLDGTNWFALSDPTGTTIALTAAGGKAVLENCTYVRPVLTGSTAATITVICLARSTV